MKGVIVTRVSPVNTDPLIIVILPLLLSISKFSQLDTFILIHCPEYIFFFLLHSSSSFSPTFSSSSSTATSKNSSISFISNTGLSSVHTNSIIVQVSTTILSLKLSISTIELFKKTSVLLYRILCLDFIFVS